MNDTDFFKGKRVLVTGGAGSIGREIVRQLLEREPKEIIVIDNNETELFLLLEQYDQINGYVGDITNKDFVWRHMASIDIVLHTAALKHVILGEKSPDSIVETNVIGLQNVLDAALENNVERVVFTSSDKAVNPTNVMGTSKLLGERLVTAANSKKHGQRTIFCSARFGNVIGSRGGVFHIFKDQALSGNPLTLTDKRMTRFIMSIEQAAKLILDATRLCEGGEVFVTKMPTIRIENLAEVMRDELAPREGHDPKSMEIHEIGAKPGEKMYEELMSDEEVSRAHEYGSFFVVLPAFRSVYDGRDPSYVKDAKPATKAYHSSKETPMSNQELKKFLYDLNLLEVEQ